MKKYMLIATAFCSILSLCTSCNKANTGDRRGITDTETKMGITESITTETESVQNVKNTFKTEKDNFLYPTGDSFLFTVADNGDLYYIEFGETKTSVIILDLNGENIGQADIATEGAINNVAIWNNIFYFSYTPINTPESTDIIGYDFNTNTQNKIASIENLSDVKKIVPCGGKLYLLGKDSELKEILMSVNLKDSKIESAFAGMPVMIAGTDDSDIMIYAYDEKDGYYFQQLNSSKKIIRNDFVISDNFEMYGSSNIIYLSGQSLKLSPLDVNDDAKEIVNDISPSFVNCLTIKSGHLFYKSSKGIRRVSVDKLIKNATVITIAYTGLYDVLNEESQGPKPILPRFGYQLTNKPVGYEEFALSVLSGDSTYDMYFISTWHGIADNIRRKGAFLSLNSVPNVSEYLEACFPYVKEAAMDKDRNVWMIPVELEAMIIKYN